MERPKTSHENRPKTARRRPVQREGSLSRSGSVRTSSPSGAHRLPELNISGVSAISHLDVTGQTAGGISRQAQLERYKTDKEEKENEYASLEVKALMAYGELTWNPPTDLLEKQTKSKEVKKKIEDTNKDIQYCLELYQSLSLLVEAQSTADLSQKLLNETKVPPPEHVNTLEDLVKIMERAQLVANSVILPQGHEFLEIKSRLDNLFSYEDQQAVENAEKYAACMAQFSENVKNIELASEKLNKISEEKEMWGMYVKSLQESLDLANIWRECHHSKNSYGL